MSVLKNFRVSGSDVPATSKGLWSTTKLMLGLIAVLLLSMPAASPEVPASNYSRRDRLTIGFFFTASTRQVAFPVRSVGGSVDVMVIDLQSKAYTKLTSKGAQLLSPSLSTDGDRILLVRLDNETEEYELLSCTTSDFVCRSLIATKNSINSPKEVSPNKVIYVASPVRHVAGVQSHYLQHDLWIVESGKPPRQLTDFQFYQMNWLSVTSSSIYFSAMGPLRDKKIIPKFAPLAAADSDIFKLPFDVSGGAVELPQSPLTPLFLSAGRSVAASVAPDESMAALLRTKNNVGGYRYDLVVMDLKTGGTKLIESTGLGFSRPEVLDRTVTTREIFNDRYVVGRLLWNDESIKPLVEVTDALIASTQPTEIRRETEGK